jgi:hypothetical protein
MAVTHHDAPDSGNRVTMAQVYRTVDDMGKTMEAHFDGVKMRLDALAPLPGRVDGLERTLLDHEIRLVATERDRDRLERVKADESTWRRTQLPAILLAAAGLILTLALHFL